MYPAHRLSPENFRSLLIQIFSWIRLLATIIFPALLLIGLLAITVEKLAPGSISTSIAPISFLWWSIVAGFLSNRPVPIDLTKRRTFWQIVSGLIVGIIFVLFSVRFVWDASIFLALGIAVFVISFITFIFLEQRQDKEATEPRNLKIKISRTYKFVTQSSQILVITFVSCIILWFINQNVAFLGTYTVQIGNFFHLPRSVKFAPGYEAVIFDAPTGLVARPLKDRTAFQVTLPRGFETLTMKAVVDADPFATLILSAKSKSSTTQATAFRLPTAFGNDWRSTALDGGRLQLRDRTDIQNADAFWAAFKTFRKVYTVSGDLASEIPTNLFAKDAQLSDIYLGVDYRGPLTINAYLDNNTKNIRFTKKDLDFVPGTETLNFTLERGGKIIAMQEVGDDGGQSQEITVELPEISGGFYDLRFVPNNEDSVVRNIQFRGIEALIQTQVFFAPSSKPITIYTSCQNFSVEAVHDLGMQSSLTVNGRKIAIKTVKKSQEVNFTGAVGTLVIPRGDVSLSSSCGFSLKPDHPIRDAFNALTKRIVPLPAFTSAAIANAEVVFDDTPLVQVKTKTGYVIEKQFNLHALSAKGKTFTLSIESPGLSTRSGAYLYIEKLSFTAKRPVFSLSDFAKIFKTIF